MIIMRQNVPWCLDNYDEMIAILPIHNGTFCPIMDWEIFGHKYFHFQASRSAKMGFVLPQSLPELLQSFWEIFFYMSPQDLNFSTFYLMGREVPLWSVQKITCVHLDQRIFAMLDFGLQTSNFLTHFGSHLQYTEQIRCSKPESNFEHPEFWAFLLKPNIGLPTF